MIISRSRRDFCLPPSGLELQPTSLLIHSVCSLQRFSTGLLALSRPTFPPNVKDEPRRGLARGVRQHDS